jgi:hypothetical protein
MLVQIPKPSSPPYSFFNCDSFQSRCFAHAFHIPFALQRIHVLLVHLTICTDQHRSNNCNLVGCLSSRFDRKSLLNARTVLKASVAIPIIIDWWYFGLHWAFQANDPIRLPMLPTMIVSVQPGNDSSGFAYIHWRFQLLPPDLLEAGGWHCSPIQVSMQTLYSVISLDPSRQNGWKLTSVPARHQKHAHIASRGSHGA